MEVKRNSVLTGCHCPDHITTQQSEFQGLWPQRLKYTCVHFTIQGRPTKNSKTNKARVKYVQP